MPFVKLDCGILNSTLWFEKSARDMFLTALLMAEPRELLEPMPTIRTRSLQPADFSVPPGWYGFVPAAGVGIMHRAKIDDEAGYAALELLASPEPSSRSREFDGRRMVRVDGGFLILNYMKYRERDYTGAERAKRYRQRLASKSTPSRRDVTESHRDITQAEYRVQSTEAEKQKQQKNAAAAAGPTRVQSDGPLAGSLPRDHIAHGFCGRRFCVTSKHFSGLSRTYGDGGDAALTAWLTDFDARLDGAFGGPVWLAQHWDAHLVEIGRVKPAPAPAKRKPANVTEALKAAAEAKR